MGSTINVSLNKITQEQGIYPRFNMDFERIHLFAELMESGDRFPPVKIVRKSGFYVLLDGNHRLEACKKLGKEKIAADVFEIPEKLWRLAAARFNGKSSMPLKGGELKKVIENAWNVDGIRDTAVIARELGCSDRYVRKVLNPTRKKEKEKLENKVREMIDKGVPNKEAALKLDMPKATFYRIKKKSMNSQNETVSESQNGTVPKWASLDPLGFPGEDQNKKIEGKCGEEAATTIEEKSQVDKFRAVLNLPLPSAVRVVQGSHIRLMNTERNESAEDEAFPDSALDDPDYPNLVTWKPGMKETHRVLDMIYVGWSIDRITKKLDVSPVWVRNTALVLLFVYHYGRDECTVDEIAERFKVDKARVEYIVWLNLHFTALPPKRKNLAIWLQTYPPRNQDPEYLELMRREKIYLKCVEEGKKPPWEYQEGMPEPFQELPRRLKDKFYQAADFIDQVAELASLGLFQEEAVEKDLLSKHNRLRIAMNSLEDAMRQKEYLTKYNEAAMKLKAYNYIHKQEYKEALM